MNSGSFASVLTFWYPAGGGPVVKAASVAAVPAPRVAPAVRSRLAAPRSPSGSSWYWAGGAAGVRWRGPPPGLYRGAQARDVRVQRLDLPLGGDLGPEGIDVLPGGAPAGDATSSTAVAVGRVAGSLLMTSSVWLPRASRLA